MSAPAVVAASGHSPHSLDYYEDYGSSNGGGGNTGAAGMGGGGSFMEHSGLHLTSYTSTQANSGTWFTRWRPGSVCVPPRTQAHGARTLLPTISVLGWGGEAVKFLFIYMDGHLRGRNFRGPCVPRHLSHADW